MQSELEVAFASRERSDTDIMACILGETRKGAMKTDIMHRCNLSHKQLHVYLKFLLGKELLRSHSNVYKTTMKGLFFLDAYDTLEYLTT